MPRYLNVAAAQMGPIPRSATREETIDRLISLLREAQRRDCELVVFTECTLGPFFAHWYIEDEAELNACFEREMPGPSTQPLFDEAKRLKLAFVLGYPELTPEGRRFNTSILVDRAGKLVGKYRKIHLPGHPDHRPQNEYQNLEKRYFEVGDLGFPVWRALGGVLGMCICNDRRWPETYRVLGLQGVELVALGYNTPCHHPEQPELDRMADFHHLLSLQAGAYQNGTWVVAAAKAGTEEGVRQIGSSAIVAPSGQIVALSHTLDDELISYRCDLDAVRPYKDDIFNFAAHRRVEHYGLIAGQTEAREPPSQ